jgi:hypothetical protein
MSRPGFKIHFDEPPPPLRPDVVTLAVAPMDAFSGRIVKSGVKARVKDLPDHPIRNLSGYLVFKNLREASTYTVIVDPTEAGYFAPQDSVFPDPKVTDAIKTKLHLVRLMRRPEFAFESDITLIRGVIIKGKDKVENATVFASKPEANSSNPDDHDPLTTFETRTDRRGAFALALRLPLLEGGKSEFDPRPGERDRLCVTIQLHVRKGGDRRDLACTIAEGKSNSLREPIDLLGSEPASFFDPCKPKEVTT